MFRLIPAPLVEVVHQQYGYCDGYRVSPHRHVGILPDHNASLRPILVNHTSHVTSEGSVYD